MNNEPIEEIANAWKKSEYEPPGIYLAQCDNKKYTVISDDKPIFRLASSRNKIYVVSKDHCKRSKDFTMYFIDDKERIRVVSCSTADKKRDNYVIQNINILAFKNHKI